MHNAAEQLSADNSAKINSGTSLIAAPHFFYILLIYFVSVVIFGDPDDGDAVGSISADRVKVICHDGDNICDGGIIVLPAHLNVRFSSGTYILMWELTGVVLYGCRCCCRIC